MILLGKSEAYIAVALVFCHTLHKHIRKSVRYSVNTNSIKIRL